MSRHLDEQQISAAIAGLEDQDVRDHLGSCLVCRRQVAGMHELLDRRRETMLEQAPDWQRQRGQILDRLPHTAAMVPMHRRRWSRPLLAIAAVVLLAIAVSLLYRGRGAVVSPEPVQQAQQIAMQQADDELAVEEILAEVDAILADDSFPGFEPLGQMMPSSDQLESYLHNGTS